MLRNRHVTFGDAVVAFDLVRVDDWSGGRRRGRPGYDLDRALEGRNVDRAAVLLAHQPENFRAAAARGVGLQLSGHTHGGQLFPGTLLIGSPWESTRGFYAHGDSNLYVIRGTVASGAAHARREPARNRGDDADGLSWNPLLGRVARSARRVSADTHRHR